MVGNKKIFQEVKGVPISFFGPKYEVIVAATKSGVIKKFVSPGEEAGFE